MRKAVMLMMTMALGAGPLRGAVLDPGSFRHYVDTFNRDDEELYTNAIPNAAAWTFLRDNIPLFECPDPDIERTYYFRWWTYRKHLRETPDGYVITEFLPHVPWARRFNTISCAAGHHFYEGRWLHDPRYLDDYAWFWFRPDGGRPRQYSFWAANALYAMYLVTGDAGVVTNLLDDLVRNYGEWEKTHGMPDGLFRQIDDRDGMECSIGGSGERATINSYLYGDARAIAAVARLAGKGALAAEYDAKADRLRRLVEEKLWNPAAQFFETRKIDGHSEVSAGWVNVREEHGYTPWYFELPESGKGYEVAWKQLMDPKGFYAPFGPTTAEQRDPRFKISYTGHGCQWNGPSWPYATSVTLTALANVLNDYDQAAIDKADYFQTLRIYTKSQRRKRADGRVVPWIDEDLDPFTGVWIARRRCEEQNAALEARGEQSRIGRERGKDYNHSTYCDLVITGLVGLRPRADDTVEVHPLVPDGTWDWFCLDNVRYHGRTLTILWDRTGERYGRGAGLRVLVDGRETAHAASLTRLAGPLR